MKKLFLITVLLLFSITVKAQNFQSEDNFGQPQYMQQYFAASPDNQNKSIIFVFYNDDYCYACPQTIALIEQVYQKHFADEYSFFIIDYPKDNQYNFVSAYNLSEPLEVVLVRVQDGAVFGFEKIENLQNRISDTDSFPDYLSNRINSFLGNNG